MKIATCLSGHTCNLHPLPWCVTSFYATTKYRYWLEQADVMVLHLMLRYYILMLQCYTLMLYCYTFRLHCYILMLHCYTLMLRCYTLMLRCYTLMLCYNTFMLRCYTLMLHCYSLPFHTCLQQRFITVLHFMSIPTFTCLFLRIFNWIWIFLNFCRSSFHFWKSQEQNLSNKISEYSSFVKCKFFRPNKLKFLILLLMLFLLLSENQARCGTYWTTSSSRDRWKKWLNTLKQLLHWILFLFNNIHFSNNKLVYFVLRESQNCI